MILQGTLRIIHGPLTRYAKLRVAHAPGMPGTRFLRHRLQRKSLVSDSSMHHGTCVTHVPWCMSGSRTRGGGENVPGISGACATHNFAFLWRGPCVPKAKCYCAHERNIVVGAGGYQFCLQYWQLSYFISDTFENTKTIFLHETLSDKTIAISSIVAPKIFFLKQPNGVAKNYLR